MRSAFTLYIIPFAGAARGIWPYVPDRGYTGWFEYGCSIVAVMVPGEVRLVSRQLLASLRRLERRIRLHHNLNHTETVSSIPGIAKDVEFILNFC